MRILNSNGLKYLYYKVNLQLDIRAMITQMLNKYEFIEVTLPGGDHIDASTINSYVYLKELFRDNMTVGEIYNSGYGRLKFPIERYYTDLYKLELLPTEYKKLNNKYRVNNSSREYSNVDNYNPFEASVASLYNNKTNKMTPTQLNFLGSPEKILSFVIKVDTWVDNLIAIKKSLPKFIVMFFPKVSAYIDLSFAALDDITDAIVVLVTDIEKEKGVSEKTLSIKAKIEDLSKKRYEFKALKNK